MCSQESATKDGKPDVENSQLPPEVHLGKDFDGVDDDFKPFVDRYQTQEQRIRDEIITSLLESYFESYVEKGRVKKRCQTYMMWLCGLFVLVCVFGMGGLACKVIFDLESISDLSAVAAFVTAFIGFVSLVFGLITIITKYAFPENDEQYITEIVKAIQDNDLKHKIKNMKLNQEKSSETGYDRSKDK